MVISQNNKHFIDAKKLKLKKYRDLNNLFLIEGEKLLKEAARFNINVVEVFCTPSAYEKYGMQINFPNAFIVDEKMISDLCDSITPQGIAAVCETPKGKNSFEGRAIILDGIQDPANVGAILRSAAAAGYHNVINCNSADPFSQKALRAGMSAQFVLNINNCTLNEALSCGKEVFYADMNGEDVFSIENIESDHAIIFGNEGGGVNPSVKNRCKAISVRMENHIESLNVASAAAVIMYLLKYRGFN